MGDRILAINGVSLQRTPLKTASALLRGAPKGSVLLLLHPGQLDLSEDYTGAPLMSADYNVPHTVVVNPNVQQVKAAVVVSRSPLQPSNINVSIEGSGPVSQSTPAKSFFSPRAADQTTQDSELLNAMEGEENDAGAINAWISIPSLGSSLA